MFVLLGGMIVLVLMGLLFPVFLRSPRTGVLALVVVAPLEKLSLYAGLTWKPFLVVAPPLIAALIYRRWKKLDPPIQMGSVEWSMVAVLICSLASALVAISPARAIRMTVQFALLFGIAWTFPRAIYTHSDFRRVVRILQVSGLWVLGYSIFQFIGWPLGINTHPLLFLTRRNPTIPYMFKVPGAAHLPGLGEVVRLSSTFFDWNIFAGYVLLILCIFISSAAWRSMAGKPHGRSLLGTGLALFVLFFTFSRSAWIGSCFAFAALAVAWAPFFKHRKTQLAAVALIALIVIGMTTSFGPFGYIRSRMEMMFRGDASISKHAVYAQAALEMFRRSPALGIGLHNFSRYYAERFDPNDIGSTSHSAFLSFFAETGLIGGVANLVLIFFVIQTGWGLLRRLRPQQQAYGWSAGLLAAYIGLLVSSFFYLFYNQVYLWVIVGMLVALDRLPKDTSEAEEAE